jgi:phage protein D
MTPDFTVTANDTDITEAIKQRLVRLSITDNSGGESDSATITLDDRGFSIATPRTGAELRIAIGYRERQPLADMGLWVVDEVEMSMPPATMEIRARGANLSSVESDQAGVKNTLKSTKTRPWDALPIGDIVRTIAGESGYTARVGGEFDDVTIEHIDQTAESDMHFLTRLAQQYGALFKPAGGFLSFVNRGGATSASGQAMTPVTLLPAQCTGWRVTLAERPEYDSVGAYYHDNETAQRKQVGGSGTARILQRTYPTKMEAEKAVEAKAKSLKEDAVNGSIDLVGNPDIVAETPVTLSGFRDGIDGQWIVDSATHEIGAGYTTRIEIKKVE